MNISSTFEAPCADCSERVVALVRRLQEQPIAETGRLQRLHDHGRNKRCLRQGSQEKLTELRGLGAACQQAASVPEDDVPGPLARTNLRNVLSAPALIRSRQAEPFRRETAQGLLSMPNQLSFQGSGYGIFTHSWN